MISFLELKQAQRSSRRQVARCPPIWARRCYPLCFRSKKEVEGESTRLRIDGSLTWRLVLSAFATGSLPLMTVAPSACHLPARRAMKVYPPTALHENEFQDAAC